MMQRFNIRLTVEVMYLNAILVLFTLPGDGICQVQVFDAADSIE